MVESPEIRRRTMQAVKSRNTKPELIVRRLLHRNGYRYRLHSSDLPGKPDVVFRSRQKAIFVHGCFWHGHDCQRGARVPKTNQPYWLQKIQRNMERDAKAQEALKEMGWSVLVIWECQLKGLEELAGILKEFLGD